MERNKCTWTVDSDFGQYGHVRYIKSCDNQIETIGDPGDTVESEDYKFCPKCGGVIESEFLATEYLKELSSEFYKTGSRDAGQFIDFLARRMFALENKLKRQERVL